MYIGEQKMGNKIGVGVGLSNQRKPIEKEKKKDLFYPVDFKDIYGNKANVTSTVVTLDQANPFVLNSGDIPEGGTYTIPSFQVEIKGVDSIGWMAIGVEDVRGQHYLIEPTKDGIYTVPSYTFTYTENMPVWVATIQTMGESVITVTQVGIEKE